VLGPGRVVPGPDALLVGIAAVSLADILGKTGPPEAVPEEAPEQVSPASRLSALLSAARPSAHSSVRPDVIGDVRKALERGKFALGAGAAVSLAPAPAGNALPSGLFRKIAKAGPKPKAARSGPPKKPLTLRELQEAAKEPSAQAPIRSSYGVSESVELDRIVRLPRRPSDPALYPDLTPVYRREGGTMSLWPIQSAALAEMAKANGLLAPIGVGHGKTLVTLLAPAAMKSRRSVLLIPPQLRPQLLQKNIPDLNRHWLLPLDRLTVVAYSELSSAKSHDLLDQLKPDLIICDEAHLVKNRSSARTKRFLRYFKEHPECRFIGLSGTITRKSLLDFAHLSEIALKGRSPVPLNWHVLAEWNDALSVTRDPLPPGALRKLANAEELAVLDGPRDPVAVQQAARSAFRRRLVETEGVVATEEGAIGTSLVLTGLRPEVPLEVNLALKTLRDTWQIGADELVDILSVVRVGCQLAAGFHYRFVWPGGEPDREWLDARRAWNSELREILKLSRKGMDSPMLVENAIDRGDLKSDFHEPWIAIKDRYGPGGPPREVVWVSDFLVQDAIKFARVTASKAAPLIIWYQHTAIGEAIAAAGGLPLFGPGSKASEDLTRVDAKKNPIIVCSQKAHGTGKQLSDYSQCLFTTPPASGGDFEQILARQHRPGQLADEVNAYIYVHTEEMRRSFLNAMRDAEYIQTSQGQRQKLLYSTRVDLPEE
jgi:hypothetical protein